MKGFRTSFASMFADANGDLPTVSRVEIPLIQRDYAQGRPNPAVTVIRREFIEVLVRAMSGGEPVDLDFVYGEIEDGTLRPLDGQQRLTTLFLIHWYVAARTDHLEDAAPFLKFAYATRPTAELFCRQLVDPVHAPKESFGVPSEWITNQAWYLFTWRHDPTVRSMLVVLDAIHQRIEAEAVDLASAWQRLTDPIEPAISYYFLPIDDMPSGEELYIKMNSRGKPLTEFETFKARLEKLLAVSLDKTSYDDIVHKIDGAWTDVAWKYHGGDYIVDDELLRYFEFVIEVCEWRDGEDPGASTLLDRAENAFGQGNPNHEVNVAFLIHAFDTWVGVEDIGAVFGGLFVDAPSASIAAETGRVPLFDAGGLNLFEQCLRSYGIKRGRARQFSLGETLYLFAVLVHRQHATDDIAGRLRTLRNLVDGADDEVREARMWDLVPSVERLVRDGSLEELKGLSPDRVNDEIAKREFVESNGGAELALHKLEDHPLLRGRVFAFDLDPATLAPRAEAFRQMMDSSNWSALTAALLAKGNYGYELAGGRAYQFGTGAENQGLRWRDVFAHAGRAKNGELRSALCALLDDVANSQDPVKDVLVSVASEFTAARHEAKRLDWRYYLAKYPAMREGATGIYFGEHLRGTGAWGYSMCMLRTQSLTGSARYRDPYLLAIHRESGTEEGIESLWFSGYEWAPRWLRLSNSGAGIRCVREGFSLDPPADESRTAEFIEVCRLHGATAKLVLPIPQEDNDGEFVDTEDRVAIGAALLADLCAREF